jgi:hypothetical protein
MKTDSFGSIIGDTYLTTVNARTLRRLMPGLIGKNLYWIPIYQHARGFSRLELASCSTDKTPVRSTMPVRREYPQTVSTGARLQVLIAHRAGLWDVIAKAKRKGNLRSSIRDHSTNDLPALVLHDLDVVEARIRPPVGAYRVDVVRVNLLRSGGFADRRNGLGVGVHADIDRGSGLLRRHPAVRIDDLLRERAISACRAGRAVSDALSRRSLVSP